MPLAECCRRHAPMFPADDFLPLEALTIRGALTEWHNTGNAVHGNKTSVARTEPTNGTNANPISISLAAAEAKVPLL